MSNRLTFSLASLIVLLAFAVMPAMAHDVDPDTAGQQHTSGGADIGAHAHLPAPMVESIELVDHMTAAGSTVDGNNVMLVVDPTADPIVAADGTAAGLFTVKITFSDHLYTAIDGATRTPSTDVDLTVTAAAESDPSDDLYATPDDGAVSVAITGVADDTTTTGVDESVQSKVFFATFTVGLDLFGGQSDDDSDLPIYVWVTVDAEAGFVPTGLVDGTTTYGTANTASMREKFTIVDMFDDTLPEVTIAVPDATVDKKFTATLTFNKPVPMLEMADIMVTDGVAGTPMKGTPADGTVWTVEISPVVGATSVEVGVAATIATGMKETVTAESPPTVTISADSTATVDKKFTVTLTFSEAVALAMADIMVMGGTAGTPMPATADATMDTMWTVEITPTAGATSVEVGVAASKATGMKETVTAKTPEDEMMLAAGKYLVVVRDKANPPSFGNLSPKLVSWSEVSDEAAMPDLERLFDVGGTIQLKVTGATGLQVVFSEVMWAVDQGNVDNRDMYLGEQWIELLNRTSDKNFAISAIKISSKEGRPALAQETDRISNVVGAGADWVLGKGQNGNSGATDGSGRVEFISMYRDNEGKAGQQYEAGHASASWTKSTELYATNHRGTPGQIERTEVHVIGTTNVPRSPIIFNEIGHHSNPDYEWIELRNVSGGNVNLKNYEVTIVTNKTTDNDFIDFTGADRNVPAGGILLVVKNDPTGDPDHPLAAGWNFGARNTWTVAQPGQAHYVPGVNENSARYMVASSFGDLPSTGEFVLVLRNRQDRNGSTANDNIRDIAGYHPDLKIDDGTRFTNLWPLSNFHDAKAVQNKFDQGTVHRRQHAGVNGTDRSRRDRGGNADDGAFRDDGWSGIGYKRNADANAVNGGTPGHPDSAHARHNRFDTTTRSSVIISEIMIDQGPRNLPEWIELFNTSRTEAVSVNGWRITITNHDKDSADGGVGSFAGDLSITVTLGNHVIPPRQSYLVVARSARNNTMLPKERIHSANRRASQLLLNTYGFQIKVDAYEKANVYHHVETIGNLGPAPANDRRSNAQSFEPISWMLPNTIGANSTRISLVRVSDSMGPVDGMTKSAWKLFDMSQQLGRTLDATSYGHSSDQSSPGHNAGGVLPVELSTFRPTRLDDGSVAIRWITESELDNAGFNILRSDTRDGQFTKLNTQLIAGQGTTSERTAYEFVDKTAKPNVVYYYQIQDVSIDGDIQVLKVTHLRGHVSPAGKAATTWGKLKALQ